MTTEVSMTPRSARWGSGTRFNILGRYNVEIGTKPDKIDARSVSKRGNGGFSADESMPPKRAQFTDGHAIASDNERLPPMKLPHNFAAVVS